MVSTGVCEQEGVAALAGIVARPSVVPGALGALAGPSATRCARALVCRAARESASPAGTDPRGIVAITVLVLVLMIDKLPGPAQPLPPHSHPKFAFVT